MQRDALEYLAPEIGYFVKRKCTPTWKMEAAQTDFVDLTYLVDGEAEYVISNERYKVQTGDLVCIPKGSTREAVIPPDHPMNCYCVNFQLHDRHGTDTTLPFPPVCHIGLQPDIIRLYNDLHTVWLCRSGGHLVKSTGIFLLILHRCLELIVFHHDSEVTDGRIRKAIRYITNHYDERLKLQEMARKCELSPMYFGVLFKQVTGSTFHQYLMDIRLNNAENMLRSGEYNVGEAALACGFNDAFYFSKSFKKHRHISPSALRK